MKVDIQTDLPFPQSLEDCVGNVYPVRGGYGAGKGHVHVIISHYRKSFGCTQYSGFVTITIDADGDVVGGNNYACHYFDGKIPIARVDGIDQIQLIMRSI